MQQKSQRQLLDEEENRKGIIRNLVREVNIICKLNHPSIIKFIGFSATDFEGNSRPVLITEYISNGSLSNYIEQELKGLSNPKYDSTKKTYNYLRNCLSYVIFYTHTILFIEI